MKSAPQIPPPHLTYRVSHAMMGRLLPLLGQSCKANFELCSKQMDLKLTPGESFRLRFHLMICGICRQLPAQFRGVRALVRACGHDHGGEELSQEQLAPAVKERIARHLKELPKPTPPNKPS